MTTKQLRRHLTALALAACAGGMPLAAHAQHVVTEDEAAKLTFEALTAPPPRPVYRPVFRAFYRPAMSYHYEHGRAREWSHRFIRASYRVSEPRHSATRVSRRHHR